MMCRQVSLTLEAPARRKERWLLVRAATPLLSMGAATAEARSMAQALSRTMITFFRLTERKTTVEAAATKL